MKMWKNKQIILGLSVMCFTVTSYATIYKWEDANHEVHYSENPPANANATVIRTQTQPSSTAPQEKTRADKLEAQFSDEKKKQLEEQDKAKLQAENTRIKNANCQQAKAHLENIQSKNRVKMIDSNGNATMYTPEQKADEIAKTQEAIKNNCTP